MNINTMVLVNQLLSTNAIVCVKHGDNNANNINTAAITTTTINRVTITDNGVRCDLMTDVPAMNVAASDEIWRLLA